MKYGALLILFLILNFSGLALGNWLMADGPNSDWYLNLNKAPWTPPGWAFGAAWTTIMILFSIYLAYFFQRQATPFKLGLFAILWLLNVSWNFFFFNQHQILMGLIVLVLLTLLMLFLFLHYFAQFKLKQLLLLPYIIWLFIACSLNAYAYLYN